MRVLLLLMLLYLCKSFISAALFHSLPPRLTKVCTAAPPSGGWGSAAVPHHGPNDSKLIEAEDHSPSQEIRDVRTHVGCDQFTQLGKDETEPTQVLLGLSSTIQPINEPRVSTAVSRTPTETMKIKKEDAEGLLAVNCKTPKNGTGDVGTAISSRDVVDEAGVSSHRVTLKISPCSFDASGK